MENNILIKDEIHSFIRILIELRVKRNNYFSLSKTAYDKKTLYIPFFVLLGLRNLDWSLRRIYYYFRYNFLIRDTKRKKIRSLYLKYFSNLNNNIFFIEQYGINRNVNLSMEKVLCFGIGDDCHFEEFLAKKLKATVICADPSPASKRYIKKRGKVKNLHFYNEGVWIKDGIQKFYVSNNFNNKSEYEGDGSLTNIRKTKKFINVKCHDIKYYMKKFKINEIPLLKMDIEGACIEILDYCYKSKIYPLQITGEIEIPNYSEIKRIENTIRKYSQKYELYLFEQKVRFKKFEFLMVKK